MKKAIFLILSLSLVSTSGFCASISEIMANPAGFHEKRIDISAEVIGEALNGEPGVWINVSSSGQGLGCYLESRESLKLITYWGGYKQKGAQLKIRGVFYKDCPLHQTNDFHIEKLAIAKVGFKEDDSAPEAKKKFALISLSFFLLTALIYFIYGRKS